MAKLGKNPDLPKSLTTSQRLQPKKSWHISNWLHASRHIHAKPETINFTSTQGETPLQ